MSVGGGENETDSYRLMNIILSKIAIVSGDAELAELISAHFRAPRVYVAVIGAPTIRLEEYGVFQNDCIRVTNAIKAHHPQLVLLVACPIRSQIQSANPYHPSIS